MDLNSTFSKVKQATIELLSLSNKRRDDLLNELADEIDKSAKFILDENAKDLALMDDSNPKKDRLKLTRPRLKDIADGVRNVAKLPSPVGEVLSKTKHENGMTIKKVRVPFGVIGCIYEARPNVTIDVFALCFKSGNCCILKGGSDAQHSNEAIMSVIHKTLKRKRINTNVVALLSSGHEATAELMNAVGYVDLIIPRGGSGLIKYVRENSKVPVIETGAGICHAYFDLYGYVNYGVDIIDNAKTRRVSVCNALDCLIIHSERLNDLPDLLYKIAQKKKVTIYADERAYEALSQEGAYPARLLKHATEESFGTEFLDYKMAIKTVDSFEEALDHIAKYSSHHSECIITDHKKYAEIFTNAVDAACVYVNVPTSFTDGAQFGLGAEIGISTQKLHARGPMGLNEICTYKWIVEGKGQTRP
jgi:glutamate-5-semialdehyde dehydrogenase